MKIYIKHQPASYLYSYEDNEFYCEHEGSEIYQPCCLNAGSSGYIECGCAGQYSFYCPNPDCYLSPEQRTELILERIEGEDADIY